MYSPKAGRSNLSTVFGSSSSTVRNLLRRLIDTLTWTTLEMSVGSTLSGLSRRLKRERATKALSAVRRSSGLLRWINV